jgi:hypothetical protein
MSDRVGADRFHKNARGEQIAVRVENVAAARRLPEFALGVLLRLGGQFVVTQHLQIHQPVAQAGERQAEQPQQGQHPFQLQPFGHRKKRPAARGDRFLNQRRHERRPKFSCFIGSAARRRVFPQTGASNFYFPAARTAGSASRKPASVAPAPGRDSTRGARRSSIVGDRKIRKLVAQLFSVVVLQPRQRTSRCRICWPSGKSGFSARRNPPPSRRSAGTKTTPSAPAQTGSPPTDFFDFCHLNFLQHPQLRAAAARIFFQLISPGLIALRVTHFNSGTRGAAIPARPPRR